MISIDISNYTLNELYDKELEGNIKVLNGKVFLTGEEVRI